MHFTLVTPDGEADAMVPMPGRHNVANALAAATLALACGASLDNIVVGLREAGPVAGRLVRHRLPGDVVLVDDSYNANPGSLNARSEEHTSELQSLMRIPSSVLCLK